jgi:hypothetical protein
MESPLDPNYQISNIPQDYQHGILDQVNKIVREELDSMNANAPTIEITPVEQDERSGKKQINAYNVNYQKNVEGELIEIEGTLTPHHTGRSIEYGFEPGYFTDPTAENYWDENWETIEDEIRSKFYTLKY